MRYNRKPVLGLERFEDRLVPTIILPIVSNNGNLTITTDDISTDVYISGVANNKVEVFGDGMSLGTFPLSGKLTVNTGTGNDDVEFDLDDYTFSASVNVSTGAGDDYVDIYHGTLNGSVAISLGDNTHDGDMAEVEEIAVSGGVAVTVGNGGFDVDLGQDGFTSVGGSFSVTRTGAGGGGSVEVYESSIAGNVVVNSGDAKAGVAIGITEGGENNTTIGGSVSISAGGGKSAVVVGADSDSTTTIAGSATISVGGTQNAVGVTTSASIGGSLTINAGDGKNYVVVGGGIGPLGGGGGQTNIGGSLSVTAGTGVRGEPGPAYDSANPTINLEAVSVKGSVSLSAKGGYDFILGDTADATAIGGSLTITSLGASADSLSVNRDSAGTVSVGGSMTVNLGEGSNSWDVNYDFTVGRDLLLTSGGGDDSLTLFGSTAGRVFGNLIVNLGNGTNSFTFNGTAGTATTGLIQYTGGSGNDSVTLNGRMGRQLLVTLGNGTNSFTYGGTFSLLGSLSTFTALLNGGSGVDTYTNNSALGAALTAKTTRISF